MRGRATRPLALVALHTRSDSELAQLAHAGHQLGFEVLARRHRRALLAHARRILGDDRAEDAVQEALLKAFRALREHEPPREVLPWLHRVCHNSAIDVIRRSGPGHEQLVEASALDGGPDDALARREALRELVGGLRDLPRGQRDALLLRELYGASHAEIAIELQASSAGAVRQLIHRARTTLREAAAFLFPPGLVERLAGGAGQVAEPAAGALAGGLAAKGLIAVAVGALAAGGVVVEQRSKPRDPAHGARAAVTPAALPTEAAARPAPAAAPASAAPAAASRSHRSPRAARRSAPGAPSSPPVARDDRGGPDRGSSPSGGDRGGDGHRGSPDDSMPSSEPPDDHSADAAPASVDDAPEPVEPPEPTSTAPESTSTTPEPTSSGQGSDEPAPAAALDG